MTARVNLLPDTTRREGRQSSQRVLALLIVVVVLAGLALATFWQRGVLHDAEDEFADAQAELAAARAEVAELNLPAELEAREEQDQELISLALSDQVSLAGILQDIAMVIPTGSDIASLNVNFVEDGDGRSVGVLAASGESVDDLAPGIERLILQFERAVGFRDVFVTSTSVDEEDVTSYSLELNLGPEHRTERYVEGLPEGGR